MNRVWGWLLLAFFIFSSPLGRGWGWAVTASAQEAYACYTSSNTTLTFYYDNLRSTRTGSTLLLNTGTDAPKWNGPGATNITSVVFDASFANARPTSTFEWFCSMTNLTSITGIEYLNTSQVTNMSEMFTSCKKLTSVDLSHFNTSNVTSMHHMFQDCIALSSLDLTSFNTANVTAMYCMFLDCSNLTSLNLSSFNTARVTHMYSMFSGCSNLTSLNLSSFNTSNVTSMYHMFNGCSSLTSLNLSGINTTQVTDMNATFSGCSNLTSLDLSGFDTHNVTSMNAMFSGCSNLTSLDLSGFDTHNVTNMYAMFSDCSSLTSLDLSSFNTAMVTNMSYMFSKCSSLTSLDLTNFNTALVTNMDRMFLDCSDLKTIYASSLWNVNRLTNDVNNHMFEGCTNLVGGQGTTYKSNYTGISRAHIDGGGADPGYLTDPNANGAYAVLNDGTLTFYYDKLLPTRTGTIYSMPASTKSPDWPTSSSVTAVVFDSSFANYQPTNTNNWFKGMARLPFFISYMPIPFIISENTFPDRSNQTLFVPVGCLSNYTTADYWNEFKEIKEPNRITFEDSNVEAICVQNWDTDGNGYLDQVEAYMITDLGTIFRGKTQITKFNELQYFTNLTTISSQAFSGCTGLTTIAIPSNVTTFGDHAFSNCSSLAIITNLNNVNTIGASAFYGCTSLASVSIDVATVESNTFSGCSNLSQVTFGSKVANIKEGAFKNCTKLTTISIPGAVVSINSNCFEGCTALNTVTLHQGTKYLLPSAFKGCYNLQTINLPEGLLSIGESAFHTCQALKSIDIPSTVTNIEGNVFLQCTSLTTVTVNWQTPLTVPATAFPNRTRQGLVVPKGTLAAYQAADVWKEFKYFREVGAGSTTIKFADANVEALCVQHWDLDGDGKLQIDEAALVTSLGSVFSSNVSITSFNELQYFTGLTAIGNSAFTYCTQLTSIVIPENVQTIGTSAFDGCTQLPKIDIPASVTSIGQYAFRNTPRLKTVTVNWTTPISVTADAFPNRANQGLYVPAGKKAAYQAADVWKEFMWIREAGETPPFIVFEDPKVEEICLANWDTDGDGYLQMDEAAAVTSLGNKFKNSEIATFDELIYFTGLIVTGAQSFRGCTNLRSIVLPSGLSTISGQTFYGCTSLASVEIPTSVTAIQGSAFSGCTGLKRIDIPSSVESIGGSAFNGCTNLEEVTVHWTTPITGVDETAFPDRASQLLNVPAGTKAAYRAANVWKDFLMDYGIAVKGVDVSFKNNTDILGDGKVSYDPETHTLTLNNANISTDAAPGVQVTPYYLYDDLTINLVGSNTLTISGYIAMPLRCNTTINGTGTLTLTGTGGYIDMRAAKQLTIEGGCIINATDISCNTDGASLVIRDVDTQVNLTTGISGFDSVTLEDGLTFAKPVGGYYDTTNKYVATIFGSQWNSGVTISSRGDYGLSVKGISVNPTNQDDVLGDGTVSFDPATLTLTLNNASIVTESGHAIETIADYSGEQLIIELLGQNYIDSGDDYQADILLSTNTFIKGPGELTLEDNSSSAIWINGGHHLFITYGCTIRARFIDAIGSDPGNLFVTGADTRIILRAGDETEANIYGFNDVILDEDSGLEFTYPAGAWYDGYELCVMNSEGEAYGVTIECPPYVVFDSSTSTLTFYNDRQRASHNATTEKVYFLNQGSTVPAWYSDNSSASVTNVVFHESFADVWPTSTYGWFTQMKNLTNITGIEYLNTSEVTTMRSMFNNCSKLTSIDLSHFNTAKVTSMRLMFYNCKGLTSLNVSSFNTANVTDMNSMFQYCSSLTGLDVSNFNTANVTDMSSMFHTCSSLMELDLSNFNTANVSDMQVMFVDCSNLTSLNLSSFNTKKVTAMNGMFWGCSSLTELDLSSFNTANVTNMKNLFIDCSNLKTIYVSDKWSMESIVSGNSTNMFLNCTSLVGGQGTVYSPDHVHEGYAHIDGGASNPGYFSEKPDVLLGDVNGDGKVDVADITALTNYLIAYPQPLPEGMGDGYNLQAADVDGSGTVTSDDVPALVNMVLGKE
ncbi:MAG: leucine-rich repeat protein [Prevotella sp.]|nr:leucine-rich repeat protein [Prevotella sp.]